MLSPEINEQIISPVVEMLKSASEKPLTVDQIKQNFGQMRKELLDAKVNLLNPSPETIMSLAQREYPNSREGRGPGVVATLGNIKATALIGFCAERCKTCPKTSEGGENSRGRGLKQAAADIIELLLKENPTDEEITKFVLRTNRRIKKYCELRPEHTPDKVKDAYTTVPQITPDDKWRQFKSIPYDSLPNLWDFLIKKSLY